MSLFQKLERLSWLFVVLSTSFFFLGISRIANAWQSELFGSNRLLEISGLANDATAFSLPLVFFVFLSLSLRWMLSLVYEGQASEGIVPDRAELREMLALAFLPMLLFSAFYYMNLLFCDASFQSLQDLKKHSFFFGLGFDDFRRLGWVCRLAVYGILVLLLHRRKGLAIGRAVLVTCLPSLILFGFQQLFSLLLERTV